MNTSQAVQSFLYNRKSLNRRPSTLNWYARRLSKFALSYPDLPLEPEPIEEFLSLVTGQPENRHSYFRTLKALYRFVCRRRRLQNPMDLVDSPICPRKVMPTLEPRQMMALLNLAASIRDRALLSLYIDNGARVGEVVGIRKHDIRDSTIHVDGKTGGRQIPISEETRRLLLNLAATSNGSDFIFLGQRGPLTTNGVYRIVSKYMKKAGISGPKLGPHRLRHSFGRGFLVNGGDVRTLQEILGHTDIRSTQRYSSLNLTDIIAKHHQFTPLRSAHAAAQGRLFDVGGASVLEEAEEILAKKEANHGD